jgi:hypothetical protein
MPFTLPAGRNRDDGLNFRPCLGGIDGKGPVQTFDEGISFDYKQNYKPFGKEKRK